VERDVYKIGARVVEDPYARPIQPTRSRL
jgi:hypothetical protein